MNSSLIAAAVLALVTSIPLAATAADTESKKSKRMKSKMEEVPEEFEGQKDLIKRLDQLNRARAVVQEGKETSVAIDLLREVGNGLIFRRALKKGNYVVDMRRFAEQGIRHLERGETKLALEDIDGAIKACNRAAQVGEKK